MDTIQLVLMADGDDRSSPKLHVKRGGKRHKSPQNRKVKDGGHGSKLEGVSSSHFMGGRRFPSSGKGLSQMS